MAQSSMDLKLFILLISIYILRCIVKQIMHTSTSLCLYTLFTLVGGLSPLQIEANPQVLAEMFLGWKYYNPYCLIEISCASYIHCIISNHVLCVFTMHIVIIFQILAIVLEIEWMISGFLAPLTSKHYHRQYQCAGAIAKCPFNQQVFSFGSLVFTNENLCHYIFLF